MNPYSEEKLFDSKVNREHNPVETAIFWCFDPRFWKSLLKTIRHFNLKPGEFDVISVAGASKGFGNPKTEYDQPFLLDQLMTALVLHKAKRTIFLIHSDCGAYGYPYFETAEEEQAFLHSELKKNKDAAERLLKKKGLKTEIIVLIARFDGVYRVII